MTVRWDELTAREREALTSAADGLTTKETAVVMQVSAETAKYHRTNAIAKLGAANMAHAVALAFRAGILC